MLMVNDDADVNIVIIHIVDVSDHHTKNADASDKDDAGTGADVNTVDVRSCRRC